MTVANNYAPVVTAANGSATVFSGPWNALAATNIIVQLLNTTTGVYTPVTQGGGSNQFQVTTLTIAGFVITFNTAPASGNNVVISRNTPQVQTVPYTTSRGFQGSVEEGSFDALTAMQQESQDAENRSLKFPVGSTQVGVLPTPIDQDVLMWSGTTGIIVNGPNASQISGAAASAAAAAASAATASAGAATVTAAIASVTYLWAGTATGTADAQVITTSPAPTLAAGQKYRFIPVGNNTALSPTLSVNGVVKNVRKNSNGTITSLTPNDMSVLCEVEYDGAQFILLTANASGDSVAVVASAGTLDLHATSGDIVAVSGTTTVTGITLNQGQKRTVYFQGSLVLTNGASLVLPTGANFNTSPGDIATFQKIGTIVYCTSYLAHAGVPLAAAKADQVAASSGSLYVSPSQQQQHPSAAKAWVSYTTITTTSIYTSYNVASLTDNGVGDTFVTLNTPFSSSNWGWSATAGTGSTDIFTTAPYTNTPGTNTLRIGTFNGGRSLTDCGYVAATFFGAQ